MTARQEAKVLLKATHNKTLELFFSVEQTLWSEGYRVNWSRVLDSMTGLIIAKIQK